MTGNVANVQNKPASGSTSADFAQLCIRTLLVARVSEQATVLPANCSEKCLLTNYNINQYPQADDGLTSFMIHQLTYMSFARPDVLINVSDLLHVSRCNNQLQGITGLLIYDGRRFLQTLEGDQAAVDSTMARIRIDERHRAITVLWNGDMAQRQFTDWAMGYGGVADPASDLPLSESVDALTATIPDANVQSLFRTFARIDQQLH